jgi:hypothetical protein
LGLRLGSPSSCGNDVHPHGNEEAGNMSRGKLLTAGLIAFIAMIVIDRLALDFGWGGAIAVGLVVAVCVAGGENAKYRRKQSAGR